MDFVCVVQRHKLDIKAFFLFFRGSSLYKSGVKLNNSLK